MTGLGPKIGTVCEKATNVVVGMASKLQNIVEHNLIKSYLEIVYKHVDG